MGRNHRRIIPNRCPPIFFEDFVVCKFVVPRQRSGQKKDFVKFFNRNRQRIIANNRPIDLCRKFVIPGFVVAVPSAWQKIPFVKIWAEIADALSQIMLDHFSAEKITNGNLLHG